MTHHRITRNLVSIAASLGVLLVVAGCPQGSTGTQSKSPKKTHKSEVAPIPTPPDVVDKMLEMAGVTKDDVVWDLGCGDGRIVIAAAKKYGCKAAGFEIEPDLVAKSRENARAAGVEELVTIEERDIFTLDLSEATVVTLYLLPQMNEKLVPQIEKMKPGSRVVAHDFGIKGYKPADVVRMESTEDESRHAVLLYTTPLEKQLDE